MIIAQITDMHLTAPGLRVEGRIDTNDFLARCVARILRLDPQPDVLLATGDLANLGEPEEYRVLRRLLAPLPMPVYLIPGNHDERDALRAEFTDHAYLPQDGSFLHYTVEEYSVRLVALDTVIAGEGAGELCSERLAWLEARLAEARDRPTLILMHHPPFVTGIRHMDAIGLVNGSAAFGAIVARNPQVEAIVCGHVHRSIQTRFHGTVAVICPSTAHQIEFDLRPDGPGAFNFEPSGFMLHVWDGARIVTHTVPVGDYPGPFIYED